MIRRPPRSTLDRSSAASDVYKRQAVYRTADLDIFDFDRCTGLFSDPVNITIDDSNSLGGLAFSPNSRFLYVSSVLDVYQYDTEASDIASSMAVSYTHLRAHETVLDLVCRLLLEKKKQYKQTVAASYV